MHLTKLQKKLCNALQDGLPICARPFAEIAKVLNSNEEEALRQVGELKKAGVILRISALINYRALGKTSTLVTAHIPEENPQEVIEAVNSLKGVSHNYLRRHFHNLWFTLQAQSAEQIDVTLSELSERFNINFHSLCVERVFKLDVRFDAEGRGLLQDVAKIPKSETVETSKTQEMILSRLQNDLELTAEPFAFLCSEGLEQEEVLQITQGLIDKGLIRRIAAVVDHRKLGFAANVLFAGEVSRERIAEAGEKLARFGAVSHCYQRKTFEGWPYNLFAMMHAKGFGEIQRVVDKFTGAQNIDSFVLLPTVTELKKQPVRDQFHWSNLFLSRSPQENESRKLQGETSLSGQ